MVHKRATQAVIRNLEHEHPDYYLWHVWERLSLESLERFEQEARRWLADRSELRSWSLKNADWRAVYHHFRRQAIAEIDAHNAIDLRQPGEDGSAFFQRMAQEKGNSVATDKWTEYAECEKCEAGTGQPCVSLRSGEVAKNAHPGRRKVGAELPADTAQDAPAAEPAPATPAKRPGRATGQQRHSITVTPMTVAGYATFKATCSCGELDGSNWTQRDDAVKEHTRHVSSMLVNA